MPTPTVTSAAINAQGSQLAITWSERVSPTALSSTQTVSLVGARTIPCGPLGLDANDLTGRRTLHTLTLTAGVGEPLTLTTPAGIVSSDSTGDFNLAASLLSVVNATAPQPARALVHPATLAAHLGVSGFTAAPSAVGSESAQVIALAAAVTDAFEGATGRTLLRRAGFVAVLDGDDIDDEGVLWLTAHRPVESVASVEVAEPDLDGVALFDASTLLGAADWSLLLPDADYPPVGRFGVLLRAGRRVAGLRNVRITLTCGYAVDDGTPIWQAPAGQVPLPPALRDAAIRQAVIWWRRRETPHVRYQGMSTPTGGTSQTGYSQLTLDPVVMQALLPYATAECAMAMQFGGAAAAGAGGQA